MMTKLIQAKEMMTAVLLLLGDILPVCACVFGMVWECVSGMVWECVCVSSDWNVFGGIRI